MIPSTDATHVAFSLNTEQANSIEELAWAHNCLCITHEPPDEDAWPAEISLLPQQAASISHVTFENPIAAQGFQKALKDFFHIDSHLSEEKILPWLEYHRPYSQPFDIGSLHIIPEPPPSADQRKPKTLYLPAGAGFGTGRHATTASCLALMQQLDCQGKSIIDFGCGSGILSLGAVILGAKHVWLHDHDAQAMTAAEHHLHSHGWADKSTLCADASLLPQADILLANILFEALCSLETFFYENLLPAKGLGVFSGILVTQEQAFLEHFKNWSVVARQEEQQWCSLVLQKD